MKRTIRLLSMAFVALSVAAMVSCEPDPINDNPPTPPPTPNEDVADIEYYEYSNPQVLGEYDYIDIQEFDNTDFLVENLGMGASLICGEGAGFGLVTTASNSQYDYTTMLNDGDEIGPNCRWSMEDPQNRHQVYSIYYESGRYEDWNHKVAYVGFCAKKHGTNHYGWLKLGVEDSGRGPVVTVYSYAYERTADKAIKAGRTK